MRRMDRRHSVAGSPSKVPKKNSPKKTNARAVLAFRMKGILGFGRADSDSPLPLPKLRPGGGRLSPIVTRKRTGIKRSESLPEMRLSFSSCADDHAGEGGADGEEDGKKPREFGDFHAELCARVANLAASGATEANTVDSPQLTSEDGSDSMVEVECPGDEQASKSFSVTSSLEDELDSDETECLLRFSPLGNEEDEEKTDSGQEEREFVSIARRDEENAGLVMEEPAVPRVRVGEVSYSPIHTSLYAVESGVSSEEEEGSAELNFELMLRQENEVDSPTSQLCEDQVDVEFSSENDTLTPVDDETHEEESAVPELVLSDFPEEVFIASPLANVDVEESDGWESADNESNNGSWVGDGGSTCSIQEPDSTPLSLGESTPSDSGVVELDEDQRSSAVVEGRIHLALGYIDSTLEGVVALNDRTRRLQQLQEGQRVVQLPRIEEDEDSSDNTWVEAELEPISGASSTPVSTFDSSTGGEEDEAFTELISRDEPIFDTQEAVRVDEEVERVVYSRPPRFPSGNVAHTVPHPFRFADMISDEQQLNSTATTLDAGGCKDDLSPLVDSPSFTAEDEEIVDMKEDEESVDTKGDEDVPTTVDNNIGNTPEKDNETPTKPTRRLGTNISIGLTMVLVVLAVLGVIKTSSSPRRVLDTPHFTNADCRKILRDLGWIKNHRMAKIDEDFPALDGGSWNASDLITAPCEVVLATQTPDEIAAYEHKMHQVYQEMEAETLASRGVLDVGAAGVEGKLILCLAFTLLAWALLQYDSLT